MGKIQQKLTKIGKKQQNFQQFFKQKFEFIYDDKVVKNDTPEKEEKAKEKGLKRNIKKNMTKDKNFNEILDGLKVESVKFMKKNETQFKNF